MRTTGCWRIGTSGWVYSHWRGTFYPAGLRQAQWFDYYARYFDTVEINNTFYRLQAESVFDAWREQAPPGFLYAVKANRYITHMRRLIDAGEPLARFLERARRLGPALGPILYQLPPRWRANLPRLESFISLLPADLTQVFEFRDPTWFEPAVPDLLRTRGLSFCIFHMAGLETPLAVTGRTVYVRLHGPPGGDYDRAGLGQWAQRVREWCGAGHDVYVYFNNDILGYAVRNALALKELLGENTSANADTLTEPVD
jgi:uncharacterized protein YecE (DUF72 family)